MSNNFFPPVQICNVLKEHSQNTKLLSFDEINNTNKKNLKPFPRPISSKCCNYLNPSYNCFPSSCCFKNEHIGSLTQTEINSLKNKNYAPNNSESLLLEKIYSNIDFKPSNILNIKSKNKNDIYDYKDNSILLNIYNNKISEPFQNSIKNNKIFNEQTKQKTIYYNQ